LSNIRPEGEYLVHLLSSVINDKQPQSPPVELNWEKLYKLSDYHKVSNMVFYGVKRLNNDNKPPQSIMTKFDKDYKKGIWRETIQHTEAEQILKTFEENCILCMPLKGYLIKYLYPQSNMRQMADIDILIMNEQTEQIKKLMSDTDMGFTLEREGENHDVYYKKPFMNIEIHRRLVSENSPYSDYFHKVWDRAQLKDGCKFIYRLSNEDQFIYIMAHLAKHYANGGTGIRSIMDIWIYNKHYSDRMDWKYIQSEFEKINLWEFAKTICGLSDVWFGNKQSNEFYDHMAEFIFTCGVYGTRRYSIISSINKEISKCNGSNFKTLKTFKGAKIMYWLQLFFLGQEHMKILYPFLETKTFLLPVCWMLRGIKCLLFKTKHTFQIIKSAHLVSEADLSKLQSLHKKDGLIK